MPIFGMNSADPHTIFKNFQICYKLYSRYFVVILKLLIDALMVLSWKKRIHTFVFFKRISNLATSTFFRKSEHSKVPDIHLFAVLRCFVLQVSAVMILDRRYSWEKQPFFVTYFFFNFQVDNRERSIQCPIVDGPVQPVKW